MVWQHISPEATVKGCKKCCISNAVDGTDDDMLWKGSAEDGHVRSECEEDEGTDCEDRDNDSNWCIMCMQLIVKYFFLSRHFIFGEVILDLEKYFLPWQTCFIWWSP